jgi:hypothetical protein
MRQRRHGRRHFQRSAFRCAAALSVPLFVLRKKPAEDGSGFGIGQVEMAQIPERRAHAQALEMVFATAKRNAHGFGMQIKEQFLAFIEGMTHRKRSSTLAEVANAAVFLASDQGSGMTGTVANLTGGLIAD